MCEPYLGETRDEFTSYNHTYPAYTYNANGGVIAA